MMKVHRMDDFDESYYFVGSVGCATTLVEKETQRRPPKREFYIGFAGANPGPSWDEDYCPAKYIRKERG